MSSEANAEPTLDLASIAVEEREDPESSEETGEGTEKPAKRAHPTEEGTIDEGGPAKKVQRTAKQNIWAFPPEDDVPMHVPVEVRNGVRHLAPYWTVYRTRAKGRWFGRPLVECFSKEFLSTDKNYAKVACRLGRIWVNGKQMTDVDYVIKSNDTIEHWGHRHEHPILDEPIRIVADTPSLFVIDKPASMPVHACGQYAIHTVLGQLRVRHGITGLRVLHRLDRTTSGILMFARDYETDREFKGTLKDGHWKKEYVCRVEGVFPEEEITVTRPIGTLVISMGIQCVREDGKTALTRFKRLWTDGRHSVVRAEIETGRTHQIRVHAQYLGYPIVNDDLYNRPEIWPKNGKGAEYGPDFAELGARMQAAHKASHWHEDMDPDYGPRMERMAEGGELIMPPDPPEIMREHRPAVDPVCLSCNAVKKEVPMSHFRIYLHCLRYETEKWSYSTPMPDWAVDPRETQVASETPDSKAGSSV